MQECLGINVSNKLIKYAKVQKDNNAFKVSSYGIKFYDDLEMQRTVQQIINETNSTKTPISINISNEKYYYFDFFNLTNQNYIKKAVETEFDSFCTENHMNRNVYEGRYIYAPDVNNQDKNKVIYIYESKGDLNERIKPTQGSNLVSATPTSTTLPNIVKLERNKNIMIIDLNDNTTITTILNQNIYNIDTLETGLRDAIEVINDKENSYLKTYEVLKNTTIYTMEMQQTDITSGNNEYLQVIVPNLYKVVEEIKNIIRNYKKIDQIYLTGIGTVINNVDLYFQEFIKESKIEILKPFFAESDTSINIKDYIEVNSAIALAIQGLGYGAKNLNFCAASSMDKLKALLSTDLKDMKGSKSSSKPAGPKIEIGDLGKSLATVTASATAILLFFIIIYCIGMIFLKNQINSKIAETEDVIQDTKMQIESASAMDSRITQRTMDYQKYKSNLENINSAIESKRSRKNQIPNLLNKLVYNIPKEVKLTEIKNTEKTEGGNTIEHIYIYAESSKYEQLAYFKAKLKTANVLDNIVSTVGKKEEQTVKITIEGDLRNY